MSLEGGDPDSNELWLTNNSKDFLEKKNPLCHSDKNLSMLKVSSNSTFWCNYNHGWKKNRLHIFEM